MPRIFLRPTQDPNLQPALKPSCLSCSGYVSHGSIPVAIVNKRVTIAPAGHLLRVVVLLIPLANKETQIERDSPEVNYPTEVSHW